MGFLYYIIFGSMDGLAHSCIGWRYCQMDEAICMRDFWLSQFDYGTIVSRDAAFAVINQVSIFKAGGYNHEGLS
jgi:hypothetical protein